MKFKLALSSFIALSGLLSFASLHAQTLYKCDNNYYTNTLPDPRAKNCKALEGANVNTVPAVKSRTSGGSAGGASTAGQKVDSGEQRARDSDARQILEQELKKAETKRDALKKEYNNGAPEKVGGEAQNYQKYLDRVAQLKAALERIESDISGIKREMGRFGQVPAPQ